MGVPPSVPTVLDQYRAQISDLQKEVAALTSENDSLVAQVNQLTQKLQYYVSAVQGVINTV